MKKKIYTALVAAAMFGSTASFGQLLDEKNVTITMDLQPVLQLKLEGPDQIDFTFDEISEYYSGITKYGANILRVSSSVSFDLWAVGLSQTTDFLWDNPVSYQSTGSGATNQIPISALELRQFPQNPAVVAACTPDHAYTANDDYSSAFAVYDITTNAFAADAVNNTIYTAQNSTPYLAPAQSATPVEEKYISGGDGTGAGCSVVGGSYLLETLTGGTPNGSGYYFVMDYRLLPGLPAQFPAHTNTANANSDAAAAAGESPFDADNASNLNAAATAYAAPGVYTMFVKYVLVEDQ